MGQNLFTGKDVGVLLPSGESGQRAQERMSDMILGAERLKYETYKKNSEDFLKASNVDPVFLLTDSAQKAQYTLLTEFNKKWGKVFQQYSGNLPDQVKQQMTSEKNYLIMNQMKMQSDMSQAMTAKDAVQKDVQGNLDHEDFQKRWNDYISTGKWDSSPLLPSAIDPDEYFGKTINKGNFGETKVTIAKKNADGTITSTTKIASGTEEDGRNLVASHMHSNDRLARGWIEKFQALKTNNPAEYDKYMKTEGVNPILKWAQDNYWDKVLSTKDDTSTKPITTGTANQPAGGDWVTSFSPSTGKKFSYQAPSPQTGDVGSLHSDKLYKLPKMDAIPITIKDGKTDKIRVLTSGMTSSVEAPPKISGIPYAYDKENDMVLVDVNKDFSNIGFNGIEEGNKIQIAIPRSLISDATDVNNIYIKDEGGKKVQIGTITQPKPTTNKWYKYQRK